VRHANAASLTVGLLRIITGAFTILVLLYTFGLSVASGDGNPFNYFGYFTNQTSLLIGVVLVLTGILTIARRRPPCWVQLLRGVATAYLIVVAVVYNVLVPGTGSAPAWVSAIVHVAVPVVAVVDWLLFDDRSPLPWHRIWIVLIYPGAWLAVVLVRGATDGWVPYGFLLPENGPASLFLHVAALICAVAISGVLVWWASRLSLYPLSTAWPEPSGV
jgi:hypothetical protein